MRRDALEGSAIKVRYSLAASYRWPAAYPPVTHRASDKEGGKWRGYFSARAQAFERSEVHRVAKFPPDSSGRQGRHRAIVHRVSSRRHRRDTRGRKKIREKTAATGAWQLDRQRRATPHLTARWSCHRWKAVYGLVVFLSRVG